MYLRRIYFDILNRFDEPVIVNNNLFKSEVGFFLKIKIPKGSSIKSAGK